MVRKSQWSLRFSRRTSDKGQESWGALLGRGDLGRIWVARVQGRAIGEQEVPCQSSGLNLLACCGALWVGDMLFSKEALKARKI